MGVAATLLCAGLVGFTLAERTPSGSAERQSSPLGVALLLFAVSCDAVQVLLQEQLMKSQLHLTPMHVMMHTNGLSFVPVLCAIFLTGEVSQMPDKLPWIQLVLYGASSWVGVCCFIALTRTWGGTGAVLTTNTRKLLSIVFSFVFFPKPWNSGLLLSASTVLAGAAVHAMSRTRSRVVTEAKVGLKAV